VLSGVKPQPRRAAAKPPAKAPDAPASAAPSGQGAPVPPGQGASAPSGQGAAAPSGQGASVPFGQGASQIRQNPANAAGAGVVAAPMPAIPPPGVSGLAPGLPAGTAGVSGNGLAGALPATAGEPNLVVPAGSAAHGSGNPRPNFAAGPGTTPRYSRMTVPLRRK
jgi:hypothetical protein